MRHSTITLILLLISVFTKPATADDFRVAEVFAGYSLLHGDIQKKASGWEFSAGTYLKQWLSLHVDVDAHHQSALNSLRHSHNVLFGPQFSHRTNRFTFFAHGLAGISHVTGTKSDTGFSYVAGGGLDLDYFALSIRLAQVDFQSADLFGQFQQQARFSVGIVFHLVGFADPAPRRPPQSPPDKPHPEQPD